ncbi:type II 3-dehydroquinate dehydratase [Lysinibacter sp. HNR]|uniref:type II 3-dehydroquinate dehydratase n=1 Tax=Lysinibacter sp. HNR TaxID=3031408 RepID=UPI002435C3A8|nr:type II 3-dehydroquinate dehydratase [Lysinibacter sp. HNR]WGD36291.1 3-dehydroquinate dehydratase [Lysinibacter sp. HNR]
MSTVFVLNGPNLGRLGSREPEVYGSANLDDLTRDLNALASILSRERGVPLSVDVRQTDDEAELIRWIHEAVETKAPVILNPAAFTHYSYALRDAAAQLKDAGVPLVEVHISNPHARETFRHNSVISGVATGVIAGFGFESYQLALQFIGRNVF